MSVVIDFQANLITCNFPSFCQMLLLWGSIGTVQGNYITESMDIVVVSREDNFNIVHSNLHFTSSESWVEIIDHILHISPLQEEMVDRSHHYCCQTLVKFWHFLLWSKIPITCRCLPNPRHWSLMFSCPGSITRQDKRLVKKYSKTIITRSFASLVNRWWVSFGQGFGKE